MQLNTRADQSLGLLLSFFMANPFDDQKDISAIEEEQRKIETSTDDNRNASFDQSFDTLTKVAPFSKDEQRSEFVIPTPIPYYPPTRATNTLSFDDASLGLDSHDGGSATGGSNMMDDDESSATVTHPNDNDVLCGRGKFTLNHEGNRRFRLLIGANLDRYLSVNRTKKTVLVMEIISRIRQAGGGFLKQSTKSPTNGGGGGSSCWYDIGDRAARLKVGHAMRDAHAERTQVKNRNRRKKSPCSNSRTTSPTISEPKQEGTAEQAFETQLLPHAKKSASVPAPHNMASEALVFHRHQRQEDNNNNGDDCRIDDQKMSQKTENNEASSSDDDDDLDFDQMVDLIHPFKENSELDTLFDQLSDGSSMDLCSLEKQL